MDVKKLVELVVKPLCNSDNTVVQDAGRALAWNLMDEGYLVKWNESPETDYGRKGYPHSHPGVVSLNMGETDYGRPTSTPYFVQDPPLSWEERTENRARRMGR